MSLFSEDALSRDGVVVTRAAGPEAASAACAACLAAGLDGLERKLALPQTMAERMRGPSLRHFVPVCPPFAPCFAAALRAALAGEAGAIALDSTLDDDEAAETEKGDTFPSFPDAENKPPAERSFANAAPPVASALKTRSSVRVRVEHIFGAQSNDMGGTLVRSIGLVRATTRIGLKNLAYNMRRLVQLERLAATTA